MNFPTSSVWDLRVSVHASYIPELDDLIERGSPGKRATTLARMTAFFLDEASRFNDDHVRLFDLVFSKLIAEIETKARSELSHHLAPLRNEHGAHRTLAPARARW